MSANRLPVQFTNRRFINSPKLVVKQKRLQDGIEISNKNRFSNFVSCQHSDRYIALLTWMEWFSQRGIPAVLAFVPTHGYAVYREGLLDVQVY